MKFEVLILGMFLVFCAQKCLTQNVPSIKCQYYVHVNYGYSCNITLFNPDGFNSFMNIDGIHESNKTDADVIRVYGYKTVNSTNIPRIICDTFRNTRWMDIVYNNIQLIDEESFSNCSQVWTLTLNNNQINKIEENSFENLKELLYLHLYMNKLEELPVNIFKPLVNLVGLYLWNNNLKVIHSNIFGSHQKLADIRIMRNQLDAISPEILDNTAVIYLALSENKCIDLNFWNNATHDEMRPYLQKCFDNYEQQFGNTLEPTSSPQTTSSTVTSTTSSSNSCGIDDFYQTVCDVKERTDNHEVSIELINEHLAKVTDGVIQVNQDLAKFNEGLNIVNERLTINNEELNHRIDELENKIYELVSRPCACK